METIKVIGQNARYEVREIIQSGRGEYFEVYSFADRRTIAGTQYRDTALRWVGAREGA